MSEEENSAESRKLQFRILIGSVVAIVLCVVGVLAALAPAWYQNYAPVQPIPFSHKLHAGNYKIPCLYCHAAAEYAQHAEVPGTEVCMNCHNLVKTDSPWIQKVKQSYDSGKAIAWVKVHVLPDFVHFNHKRHIAAGVQCQTCHGPIQTMNRVYQYAPLTMGWCINCHRNDDYLTPARKAWSEKAKQLGGMATASGAARYFGTDKTPMWFEQLAHKDPHNADVSCTTCHY